MEHKIDEEEEDSNMKASINPIDNMLYTDTYEDITFDIMESY